MNLIERAQAVATPTAPPNLVNFLIPDPGSWDLSQAIQTILGWFLLIAGALAVIYLIYGGMLYITAAGDAEKATKGRTALVNAIIGLVIIALSFAIVYWVGKTIKTTG